MTIEARHGYLRTDNGIHIPYQWEFADQTAREAASGLLEVDLGKLARQLDDNSLWLLTATTPVWVSTNVDVKVKASGTDQVSGYLFEKLQEGGGTIGFTYFAGGPAGDHIEINAEPIASVSANDTTPGYLNGKLVAGMGVSLTENGDGGNETFTIALSTTASEIVAIAEFAGAVLDPGSASDNTGAMTAAYDSTNRRNYYVWTTSEVTTQSYDIIWQFRIPTNFSAWSSGLKMTSMVDVDTGSTGVRLVEFLDASGTNVITPATEQNTSWVEDEFTITGGSFSAGDLCMVRVRLLADTDENALLHSLRLAYNA